MVLRSVERRRRAREAVRKVADWCWNAFKTSSSFGEAERQERKRSTTWSSDENDASGWINTQMFSGKVLQINDLNTHNHRMDVFIKYVSCNDQ